jgi:hypothetical protein
MPIVLTATGRAKIDRFLTAIRQAASTAVLEAATALKPAVVAVTPSPEDEARMLSRGFGGSGIRGVQQSVGFFGTPDGGRFIREGSMVSLRAAIEREPVEAVLKGDVVTAGFGSPARINPITGFSWGTRRRGVQGPTLPFNGAYVQAMENGGLVWTVVPRAGTKALEPEPGRIAFRMLKTVGPQRMFRGTLFMRQSQIASRVGASLRAAARGAR